VLYYVRDTLACFSQHKSIHNIGSKHAKSPKTDILWLPYSSIFDKIWKANGHPVWKESIKKEEYSIFGEAC
jgi:hypothetical protein